MFHPVIDPGHTTADLMLQLRRKRHILDIIAVKYQILFPPYRFAPLELTDVLQNVGVGNLSILHLRTAIPGGSSGDGSPVLPAFVVERETNSKLVAMLPWIATGINNEAWKSWIKSRPLALKVPAYIRLNDLLLEISCATNDHLRNFGNPLVARWFYGFDRLKPNGKILLPSINAVFALRVVDFLASQLGMTPTMKVHPRYNLPTFAGKNNLVWLECHVNRALDVFFLQIVTRLQDWHKVIDDAKKHTTRCNDTKKPRDKGKKRNLAHIPPDLEALLVNLTPVVDPTAFQKISKNFQLAAFMLGWSFQGKFHVPANLENLLAHFALIHGFKLEAAAVFEEFGELEFAGTQTLFKLAMLLTPVVLCLPISLSTCQSNGIDTGTHYTDNSPCAPPPKKMFQCLGNKPEDLQQHENAIMDQVWLIAQGVKGADEAISALWPILDQIPRTGPKNWFKNSDSYLTIPSDLFDFQSRASSSDEEHHGRENKKRNVNLNVDPSVNNIAEAQSSGLTGALNSEANSLQHQSDIYGTETRKTMARTHSSILPSTTAAPPLLDCSMKWLVSSSSLYPIGSPIFIPSKRSHIQVESDRESNLGKRTTKPLKKRKASAQNEDSNLTESLGRAFEGKIKPREMEDGDIFFQTFSAESVRTTGHTVSPTFEHERARPLLQRSVKPEEEGVTVQQALLCRTQHTRAVERADDE
ncbi:hypothetical protein DFH07DRAFT_768868 [Mycena maculata]|uniref:Uncharacterized protein n=1 Tax=Mycena maculata TaxID=230809 RepID=A0AAD7NPJ7_9AGAR|nr:hypothetical protein DFH07DRAFT_768868 [Mycena maculata]